MSVRNPYRSATASRIVANHEAVATIRRHGRTAPCASERDRFGSTRSGSISSRLPSPVQSGHAPCGELKLKLRGAGSSKLPPCSGQAYRSL